MRKIFPALLAMLSLPAMADLTDIPKYHYLYSRESGVIDCAHFQLNHTYYGDFGMNGMIPANWPADDITWPGHFVVKMSNARGEVIGESLGGSGNPSFTYGYQGMVACPNECLDLGGYWTAAGINSSGLYLVSGGWGALVGLGLAMQRLGPAEGYPGAEQALDLWNFKDFGPAGWDLRPLGINDDGQILAEFYARTPLDMPFYLRTPSLNGPQ